MGKRASETVHVLLGGGIDSSALIPFYLSLNFKVIGVHFDYGQPSSAGERRAIKALMKHYHIDSRMVDFGFRMNVRRGEVRCRNALLLLSAASMLKESRMLISMGIHSGTRFYDCSVPFVETVQGLLDGYFGGSVRFDAPFVKFTKGGVYRYCQQLRVPLELTFSCERRSNLPCGRCPSCQDRLSLYEH